MNMKSLKDFFARERAQWPTWWAEQGAFRKHFPWAGTIVYWVVLGMLNSLRPEHFALAILMAALAYGGRTASKVLTFLFPVYLTGVVYDSQRFYSDYIRGEIHVAFPYEFDKRVFGITYQGVRLTPNEFLQHFIHPALDLVTGFFYLFFIAIYVATSAYQTFWLPTHAKDPVIRRQSSRFAPYTSWAFFHVNWIGYTTYYWFPAAPPWYVTLHGTGEPAKLDTLPNPAGAIRFDEILGTHFFTGMYGRSADVFGAIPSLHVAYPLMAFFFALQIGNLRVFTLLFYLIMCFSAVYLNHHYVIDILWGSAYTVIVFVATRWWAERQPLRQ